MAVENTFFFRDKEGYDQEDRIERIKRQYVTPDEPLIEECLERNAIDKEDLDNPGKNELLRILGRKLDNSEFDDLINSLFDEHGEEGDTFNIKVFELDSKIEKSTLAEKASEFKENGLSKTEENSFSYVIRIEDFADREGQGVVDIEFKIRGKRENVSPEEIVWVEEGEERSLDEIIDQQARRKADYSVEARVYPDAGMMAITNSGIDKTLQGEIRSAVQRWG